MDYSDAYIQAHSALRETYRAANEKDYKTAEWFALQLVEAATALLADIQNKK
jgi:cell division protein FtsL